MDKELIIKMAREVGATPYTNRHYPDRPTHTFNVEQLERFAALVAAAEREEAAIWQAADETEKGFREQHELASASVEPVAWMDIDEKGTFSGLRYWSEPDNRHEVALYTSPQPAPGSHLTDEQKAANGLAWLARLEALREEFAGLADQPAQHQEPVAHCEAGPEYCPVCRKELNPEPAIYPDEAYEMGLEEVAFYTSPPASKPLTDEQILRLVPGLQDCLCDPWDYNNSGDYYASIPKDMIRLARAIEAAHGIYAPTELKEKAND